MLEVASDRQAAVDAFFDRDAGAWDAIYSARDVFSVIHQLRQATALAWLDETNLAAGTPVLEVGCGAGHATVEMARRGFIVTAFDSAPGMVERADANIRRRGLERNVSLGVADVHDPPFETGAFGLVIALGVLPWLHSPGIALTAMARMVRPGGYLIANVDNARRLNVYLDPRSAPLLRPLRDALHARRRSTAGDAASADATRQRCSQFDAMLAERGLVKVRTATLGFGPFTFWGKPVFSDRVAVALHRKVQRLADARAPFVRGWGAQYLVLARRPANTSP